MKSKVAFRNPLEPTIEEIEALVGPISESEIRNLFKVLAFMRKGLHGVAHDDPNMHSPSCWSRGPSHYTCAYELIKRLTHEHPPLALNQILTLVGTLPVDFADATEIIRRTERHHGIGGE